MTRPSGEPRHGPGGLVLASTSPQRRAILAQLRIPFRLAEPAYAEDDPPDADPVELVREHARGKARSVDAAGGVVLGVDTTVVLDGRSFGKPVDMTDAARMLTALAGQTHEVVSGLCLRGPDWEEVGHDTTRVAFRALTKQDVASHLALGEWQGRAGATRSRAPARLSSSASKATT